MNSNQKAINFLYISGEAKNIVKRIDENKYLDLQLGETTRLDLFLFAIALGLETLPTELIQKDTFIRDEYVTTKYEAFLYSLFAHLLNDKKNIDEIIYKDKVYELAQKYANTGFSLIGEMMNSKPESVSVLEMVAEMDQEYNKYFSQQ